MIGERATLPMLLGQATQDALALAKAEVRLGKAKLSTKVAAAKTGAILLTAAAIVALLGLIGLVVGCVMALATLIGPGLAGLAVFLVLAAIAAALAWIGSQRLSAKPEAVTEKVT